MHRAATAALAAALAVFTWFLRYNDPGGSFAGLTDDHFFYVVRGWQILFGELPVRDFVDHGAPLYWYLAAGVQMVLGRGTWSELVFSVTMLAACASLTFLLAARASGSLGFALVAVGFQQLLDPRFYNYPKLLAYALAIPALWAYADRPGPRRLALLALTTVIGVLLRHDHGVYIALAFAAMLLLMAERPWRDRVRDASLYGGLVLLLLAPYLAFIQAHQGIVAYFQAAYAWAARDRERAPLVWPPLTGNEDGNLVSWVFYLLVALPVIALVVVVMSHDGFRSAWPHARRKIAVVAVLAIVLNFGFLRHPLEARIADPSVPHAILLAWLGAALGRMLRARDSFRPGLRRAAPVLVAATVLLTAGPAFVVAATYRERGYERAENAQLHEGLSKALRRAAEITASTQKAWPLEAWTSPERPGTMRLAFYLRDCTAPSARVFMAPYLPQVLALSQRGFAGGNADLRSGFFGTREEQEVTLARLERQNVPVAIIATEDYEDFPDSFPLIAGHFDERYRVAGSRELDERHSVTLLVDREASPTGIYEPLDWPCFR